MDQHGTTAVPNWTGAYFSTRFTGTIVGDSITAGALTDRLAMSAYGWVLGERLGVRHTQIARSGYCLVAQGGCVGQRTQFFQTASTGTTAWDFSRYQATRTSGTSTRRAG